MVWAVSPYSAVLLLSLVVAVGTAAAAWRTRPAAGSSALAALMTTVAVWLGAHVLEIESTTLAAKLLWADLQWVCAAVIPTLFLVFALRYTGADRWLTRPRLGLLSIEPLAMIGALAVNDRTFVLWGPPVEEPISLGSWWASSVTVATAEPRIGLFVHLGYATFCLAITSVIVFRLIARTERLYRWQGAAVFVAITVPWGTAILSASSLEIIGTTPIGFTVTGLAITFGLYRYRLLEIAPIARSEVVTNLEDGVLVADADRRIVDSNPVAREVFTHNRDNLVGASIDDVIPIDIDSVIAGSHDRDRGDGASTAGDAEPTQFSLDDGQSYYDFSIAPIDDGRGNPAGWTIVVHDVTERVRRECELERKNRKLDEFASVVSHDLRNPLTVSKGYLELLEEEYDPEYVRIAIESHERMEQLIDDVLMLARQGQRGLDPEPVALEDVASEAWSTVDTAGATLSVDDEPTIDADRTQLRQLLENLFRNAVDHGGRSRSGTDDRELTVTVGALEDGFFVADSGTGFEGEPEAVFESGYTTSERGTGLGLSIVADICERHGWTVTATEGADGGARLEITGVERHETVTDDRVAGTEATE
ncbi:PAS domain-containing sensor histidine kinase [Natrinema saccharevitans]|uniref:histidine kinase n=1 Tax=Natrinema saccharevitans TaxID=301967 RepID=A0A1S8AWC3_9EURY|nr:histidine kinase N-terminal 7TM domain-containing protein [Natrinema saccharevitans]OLZ40886.1 PAS domain-containing sensor histidine kinase [Natrinema saccharevitans]